MEALHLRIIETTIMRHIKYITIATALFAVSMASASEPVLMATTTYEATPIREAGVNSTRSRLMQHKGLLRLEFQLPTLGDALVTLYNAKGNVVLKERVKGSGQHVRQIPDQVRTTGPYTMRIEQDGVIVLRKLVIEQA